jgi:hypothetical protein
MESTVAFVEPPLPSGLCLLDILYVFPAAERILRQLDYSSMRRARLVSRRMRAAFDEHVHALSMYQKSSPEACEQLRTALLRWPRLRALKAVLCAIEPPVARLLAQLAPHLHDLVLRNCMEGSIGRDADTRATTGALLSRADWGQLERLEWSQQGRQGVVVGECEEQEEEEEEEGGGGGNKGGGSRREELAVVFAVLDGAPMPNLRMLVLEAFDIAEAEGRCLQAAHLPRLRCIELHGCQVAVAGIEGMLGCGGSRVHGETGVEEGAEGKGNSVAASSSSFLGMPPAAAAPAAAGWGGAMWPMLHEFHLCRGGLGQAGAAALAVGGRWPTLRSLSLAHNDMGAGGVVQLVQSSGWGAQLTELDLRGNRVDAEAAAALAAAPFYALVDLDLSHNPDMGAGGAVALASADWMHGGEGGPPALKHLDLSFCSLGNGGAAALAGSGCAAGLRSLSLCGNGIRGDVGGVTLAGAMQWRQLTELDLSHNPLGNGGMAALAGACWPAVLRMLCIADCQLGDRGAREVEVVAGTARTACSSWACMHTVDITHNQLTTAGVAAVARAWPGAVVKGAMQQNYWLA